MPDLARENEKKVLAAVQRRRERRCLPSPSIDIHPATRESDLRHELAESLRADRLDGKFLYVSARQTDLWRRVFLTHSPIHGNPEFSRIYRDAFAVTASISDDYVRLVGLGCGTGLKEADLCRQLIAAGKCVCFSAIDVSADLVDESARRLMDAGATSERNLVCDLGNVEFIREWLRQTGSDQPCLLTFFGLVPNFTPQFVRDLLRGILQKGDRLLVSAHLAPIDETTDIPAAMNKILPQYDNPETLEWLAASLDEWALHDQYDSPGITLSEVEGIPAFIASAPSRSGGPPLRLFQSIRYTSDLFEQRIGEGLQMERLAITRCREEAIWLVSKLD